MYCCVEIKLSKNTCIQAVLYEKNSMFSKLNCINNTLCVCILLKVNVKYLKMCKRVNASQG